MRKKERVMEGNHLFLLSSHLLTIFYYQMRGVDWDAASPYETGGSTLIVKIGP